MTSKQRFLAAIQNKVPDRVLVIWIFSSVNHK
jgi:hypothetical protein